MIDALLTLNAGSSSLKFSVFTAAAEPVLQCAGVLEHRNDGLSFRVRDSAGKELENQLQPGETAFDHDAALARLLAWLNEKAMNGFRIVAAGHRVVHGGKYFAEPVRVNAAVLEKLEELIELAPLHQPHCLAALRALMRALPAIPHVACFDTAFHRTQPRIAQLYALPRKYADAGVIQYGFHGLSYEYIASILPQIDSVGATGRTIVAHLGNGASLCALKGGKSVATTMGLTPLDGLVMGTRAGTIDPGVVLHLMSAEKAGLPELEQLLYFNSGLLGVSGISNDVRTLLASSDPHAMEAIDLFVYRAISQIGALAAILGGLDALVFTAGIGENAAPIRARICAGLEWMGLVVDPSANAAGHLRISDDGSRVRAWVIPTNEELMLARHTQALAK